MESQKVDRKSHIVNTNGKSRDIKIRAYRFSLEIIRFVNGLPNQRAFWIMGDQLLRSATSIGANMIEGQASSSRKEFIRYYEIALKSANETRYWLSLFKDTYNSLGNKCETLLQESAEITNMLASSILTLKGKKAE